MESWKVKSDIDSLKIKTLLNVDSPKTNGLNEARFWIVSGNVSNGRIVFEKNNIIVEMEIAAMFAVSPDLNK